ncbi:hypothetical protein ASE73_11660 [Sphingomonas sp. Leaf24]|uniref:hypothetical protein n=1 Tax=unclassified Sphingomonas TaxID=196159 RepID=UPI0006FF6916|nr:MULTISPECIES: hypothetical protein [unclassified Sphingomonas]KQM13120.1 hypothetical protein ASE50_09710 [Sphingomonas sp. Leaf5]KQM85706.1 hypothetical protein ASE73_11660 [Sphingomonas sp. Leaf24]KQM95208.1 hypothetical protein ASE70_00210 [Sphingomonas sp. Leaf22]
MIVLLRLSAGLIGWVVAFCLMYGLHGIGCARRWDRVDALGGDLHRTALVATWLVCLLATLLAAVYLSRRRTTLLDRATMATGWTGFVATAVTFVPLLIIPSCL